MLTRYAQYIALTALDKRLDRIAAQGVAIPEGHIRMELNTSKVEYFRQNSSSVSVGETAPNLHRYAEITVSSLWYRDTAEEREDAAREFARAALELFPDFIFAAYAGESVLYFEPLEGVGISIHLGAVTLDEGE